MTRKRCKIFLNGIVQGVGFRPFVYRLARECHLTGYIKNDSQGVYIEVEGQPEVLSVFQKRLLAEAPPLAQILSSEVTEIPPNGDQEFAIRHSTKNDFASTLISPDVAVCDECLHELFDPADRRYGYPFINCTNCGPRFTIVESIPYDRANTSMRVFHLCPECEREYNDPANRRFHAQPNACPVCGPQVRLHAWDGNEIACNDPIAETIRRLKDGYIIAIRGLGGFHLAVDAHNDVSVRELRRRKGRAQKPFALMAPDMDSIEKYCHVSEREAQFLQHPSRPIVLLRKRSEPGLAPSVAPQHNYLGFMLPYTPLQHLLLRDQFDALVMTSGNISEEPIAIGNEEAFERLAGLADYFLIHNREILQRCDDSVARVSAGQNRVIRRARGFVPLPILIQPPTCQNILAVGGELKNTIALSRQDKVFLSQHIGDLDNPAAYDFFAHNIHHFQEILEIRPQAIAYDSHPEYLSTKWALEQKSLSAVPVQHHHAHLVSVMAENGVYEKTIGIILDGTGYGTDRSIWGVEVLIGNAERFERFAWLHPVPMPGGEAAIRQPWRMAVSYLHELYGDSFPRLNVPVLKEVSKVDVDIILKMLEKGINAPLTSSCGRLFDAVSALLGVCQEINYEAQAAIELEMTADESVEDCYDSVLHHHEWQKALPSISLFQAVLDDYQHGTNVSTISAKFHRTLADIFIKTAIHARELTGIERVGLSGGVFQNNYFFTYIIEQLQRNGFQVLTHSRVPTNDGGLALGQIAVADAWLRKIGN